MKHLSIINLLEFFHKINNYENKVYDFNNIKKFTLIFFLLLSYFLSSLAQQRETTLSHLIAQEFIFVFSKFYSHSVKARCRDQLHKIYRDKKKTNERISS